MVDLALLRLPTLRYGLIAAAIVAFGEFGLMFTLPLLLQGTLGYSPLGAGWLLVSLAVGAFLVSGMTHQLTLKIGQRAVVRIGLALEAIAVGGLAVMISLTVTTWTIAAWLFVYGLGVGMATAQLSSVIMSDVPPAQGGQASGLQSTLRQLGSALGIAVLGTLLVTTPGTGLQDRLSGSGLPTAAQERVVDIAVSYTHLGHSRRGEATDSLVAQNISGGCHDLGPAHDVVFGDGRGLDARHTGSVSTATRRTSFSTAVSVNCRHDLSARSRDATLRQSPVSYTHLDVYKRQAGSG